MSEQLTDKEWRTMVANNCTSTHAMMFYSAALLMAEGYTPHQACQLVRFPTDEIHEISDLAGRLEGVVERARGPRLTRVDHLRAFLTGGRG